LGIFEDKGLSRARVTRHARSRCLKALWAGDRLIVLKLDQLCRSVRDLTTMLDDLRARGVKFGRKPKLTEQQIAHARKLIDVGERGGHVASLLNIVWTTLYGALAR
jgi:hypothetical protein